MRLRATVVGAVAPLYPLPKATATTMRSAIVLRVLLSGMACGTCSCEIRKGEAAGQPGLNRMADSGAKVADRDGNAVEAVKADAGVRSGHEGVWLNKKVLRTFQKTRSPMLASTSAAITHIVLLRKSAWVHWHVHWAWQYAILSADSNVIVLDASVPRSGTIRIRDGEMSFRVDEDAPGWYPGAGVTHRFVRVSDADADGMPTKGLDNAILKPSLVGEYESRTGKHLRIGLESIVGHLDCPTWMVTFDYVVADEVSMDHYSPESETDVLHCIDERKEHQLIGYRLRGDSLTLFRLKEFRIAGTIGVFARKGP